MKKEEYDQLLQTLASFVDPRAYDKLTIEDMRLLVSILKQVRTMTFKAMKDRLHTK